MSSYGILDITQVQGAAEVLKKINTKLHKNLYICMHNKSVGVLIVLVALLVHRGFVYMLMNNRAKVHSYVAKYAVTTYASKHYFSII